MNYLRFFVRCAVIAGGLWLVSCGIPTMKPADFAVADAAARSTGKWTRADDGTTTRPRYRTSNPSRIAQVSYLNGSSEPVHYESFVSSYLSVVGRSGVKEISRRKWTHRGYEVIEVLHDYGPGKANDERYVQMLFSRTPAPKYLIVRTLGRTSNPSAVQGNDLMKALLDAAGGRVP